MFAVDGCVEIPKILHESCSVSVLKTNAVRRTDSVKMFFIVVLIICRVPCSTRNDIR